MFVKNKFKKLKFTLFEILIAITVITICFVVMLSALSLNIQNTAVSNGYITACFLTNSKLADILNQGNFSDEGDNADSEGDFGDDYQGYKWKLTQEKLENRDNLGDDVESGLYKLILKTYFEEGTAKRELKVETIVYSEPKKENDDSSGSKSGSSSSSNKST